jgi:hypothetical protein
MKHTNNRRELTENKNRVGWETQRDISSALGEGLP